MLIMTEVIQVIDAPNPVYPWRLRFRIVGEDYQVYYFATHADAEAERAKLERNHADHMRLFTPWRTRDRRTSGGRMLALWAALALSLGTLAHAQELAPATPSTPTPSKGSITLLVAGQLADAVTTHVGLDRGCTEGNTWLYSGQPSPARVYLTKAVSVGATVVLMRVLAAHGHPTAAERIGVLAGGIGFGAAEHNVETWHDCRRPIVNDIHPTGR